NTVFTYSDEHGTVGWLPHPRLTDSLRNDLTAAVGRSPRAWLSLCRLKTVNCLTNRCTPLLAIACMTIHLPQGFVASRGTVRKNYWCIYRGSDETRDGRKRSAYVERDPNDSKKIISTRKREFTSESINQSINQNSINPI